MAFYTQFPWTLTERGHHLHFTVHDTDLLQSSGNRPMSHSRQTAGEELGAWSGRSTHTPRGRPTLPPTHRPLGGTRTTEALLPGISGRRESSRVLPPAAGDQRPHQLWIPRAPFRARPGPPGAQPPGTCSSREIPALRPSRVRRRLGVPARRAAGRPQLEGVSPPPRVRRRRASVCRRLRREEVRPEPSAAEPELTRPDGLGTRPQPGADRGAPAWMEQAEP